MALDRKDPKETLHVPSPLSLAYHLRFVPRLLAGRLRPAKESTGTVYASQYVMVSTLLLVPCLLFLGYGISGLVETGPRLPNLLLTLVGGGGLVTLAWFSFVADQDVPRSYEHFSLLAV